MWLKYMRPLCWSYVSFGFSLLDLILAYNIVLFIIIATAAVATTGLTTAEAVGIAVVLSSIVSFTAGLLVALAIAHCYHSIRQQKVHSDSPSNGQQVVPMYEDVSMIVGGDIELKENIAYRTVVI